MGLAERRAVKAFQDEQFEALKAGICEAAGFDIAFDVNWESLAVDDYAHLYAEAFPKVYFDPLRDAFASICSDDMGKEALQGALTKVVIQNVGDKSSAPGCFTFADGVLTFDHRSESNIDYGAERSKALIKLLEDAL